MNSSNGAPPKFLYVVFTTCWQIFCYKIYFFCLQFIKGKRGIVLGIVTVLRVAQPASLGLRPGKRNV